VTEPKLDVRVVDPRDIFAAVDDLEESKVENNVWLESVTTMAWNVCGLLPRQFDPASNCDKERPTGFQHSCRRNTIRPALHDWVSYFDLDI
jgi:hypothetical protein